MVLRMESLSMLTIGPLLRHGQRPVGQGPCKTRITRLAQTPARHETTAPSVTHPAHPLLIAPPIALPRPLTHRHRLDGRAAPAGEGSAGELQQKRRSSGGVPRQPPVLQILCNVCNLRLRRPRLRGGQRGAGAEDHMRRHNVVGAGPLSPGQQLSAQGAEVGGHWKLSVTVYCSGRQISPGMCQ
jgi:hypothetical protein